MVRNCEAALKAKVSAGYTTYLLEGCHVTYTPYVNNVSIAGGTPSVRYLKNAVTKSVQP